MLRARLCRGGLLFGLFCPCAAFFSLNQHGSGDTSAIASPLYECSRLITTCNCRISFKLLISDADFELAQRKNPIMYKLDVKDVLRGRCQSVIGIRCPAAVELSDSDEALPGSVITIDEHDPECCNGNIVISMVADDASAIPIVRMIDAVVVGAIESF